MSTIIVNTLQGVRAVYDHPVAEGIEHTRPVVAWDLHGSPLVPNDDGRLVPARSLPRFTGVEGVEGLRVAGTNIGIEPGAR